MAGIGEQLRVGRVAAGLTVAEVARETGVPPHFLEALELDHFYELPDPVYVRGFIRTYSRAIGLDAVGLIELLPDELRFPGSTGAIIRQPPEPPPQHRVPVPPARPVPVPVTPVVAATSAPAPVPVVAPEEAEPLAPVISTVVAAAPVVTPSVPPPPPGPPIDAATASAEPMPEPLLDEPIIGAPVSPLANVIVDADVQDSMLTSTPAVGRQGWFQPRLTLPFVSGAVALALALIWLTSVIRGGGDGTVPATNDRATLAPGTSGVIEVNASPAATQTARSTVARSTATARATASPSQAPSATASPTPSPTASPTPSPTTAPSPTVAPTSTPEPTPVVEPTVSVPAPPAVPANAFALCQNLGGDNYNCGPNPVRVICAPGGGRFFDPNGVVPRPIPAEWTGWRETTISGRLELIQSAC